VVVVEVDAQMGGKTVLKKAVPLAQIGESGRTAFFSKADSIGREIARLREKDGENDRHSKGRPSPSSTSEMDALERRKVR
jgi:hypothetical protein